MRSIGGGAHGHNRTHISGKGARERICEEDDSMKDVLVERGFDVDAARDAIFVSSEVRVEGEGSGSGIGGKSYTY